MEAVTIYIEVVLFAVAREVVQNALLLAGTLVFLTFWFPWDEFWKWLKR